MSAFHPLSDIRATGGGGALRDPDQLNAPAMFERIASQCLSQAADVVRKTGLVKRIAGAAPDCLNAYSRSLNRGG
jgi:hypothetical protein